MARVVDLVLLTRDDGPLYAEVERGILGQELVGIRVHRIIGKRLPGDRCRWETVARARNEGKRRGDSPWLMFVDDDVVLDSSCISTLVEQLIRQPEYGALAADYLGERREGSIAPHVAMGATLFRRAVLDQVRFRSQPEKCECQCLCDDLRRIHWGIDYCRSARAGHLKKDDREEHSAGDPPTAYCGSAGVDPAHVSRDGRVLAAFDRRHFHLFQERFLGSLRAAGNHETVMALAIGLYPSEQRRLQHVPNVQAFFRSASGQSAAKRRLREFQGIAAQLPPETPVAYWDAGDVVFQDSLRPLWELVHRHPDRLLAVREPFCHPENQAVADWTLSIRDSSARRRAFELLARNPYLNSGFAAGTAQTLLTYLRAADHLLHSTALAGSTDWGDQTAMNLYCHANPHAWMEIEEGWNFCLAGRTCSDVYRREDGRFVNTRGVPIHTVHGNARTLDLVPLRRKLV